MAIDKRLTGQNFCGLDCIDNQNIIHPETCVDNVVLSNDNTATINDWLSNNPNDPTSPFGTFTSTSGLYNWLDTYYHLPSVNVQPATTTSLGGVIINNEYLTIASDGTLGVDRTALEIPTISTAGFASEGTIKLGNSSVISSNFADNTLTASIVSYTTTSNDSYSFPVRLDANHRAGITIPKELFSNTQVQSNWTQSDPAMKDYIQNKPSLATVATTGSYSDLSNKPTIITYSDFIGTDGSSVGSAGLVPAPDTTDVDKFLKSDGNWTSIDVGDNTRNYKVLSLVDTAYDISGIPFYTYNIEFPFTDFRFKAANIHDFAEVDVVYATDVEVNKSIEYDWQISQASNQHIAVIQAIASRVKGYFQLVIHPTGGSEKTYNVGFVIDTQDDSTSTGYTFIWISDCDWPVLFYNSGFQTNRVYLTVPNDFDGHVYIRNKRLIRQSSGTTISSIDDTTTIDWTSDTGIINGKVTSLDGTVIQNNLNIISDLDYFIYNDTTLSVEDVINDSLVNDCLLHKLIRNGN